MAEANRLIDDTKRDAAAANVKTQQAEADVKRQKARYNEVSSVRETDRKEIDALQRQVAENEAVGERKTLFHRTWVLFFASKSLCSVVGWVIWKTKVTGTNLKPSVSPPKSVVFKARFRMKHSWNPPAKWRNSLWKTSWPRWNKSVRLRPSSRSRLILSLSLFSDEGDLAELRSHSVSNDLDPSQFFRNELAQAIREIRNDYENRIDGQRSDMQNRYALLFNELIVRQQRPGDNAVQNVQQLKQEERSRSELLKTQNQNAHLKAQNEDVKNRIDDLQRKLNGLREDGGLAQARMAKEIEDAKSRLDRANRDYGEVSNMKTSLEKEIGTYRDLLESKWTHLSDSVFTDCCSFSPQVKMDFEDTSTALYKVPNSKPSTDQAPEIGLVDRPGLSHAHSSVPAAPTMVSEAVVGVVSEVAATGVVATEVAVVSVEAAVSEVVAEVVVEEVSEVVVVAVVVAGAGVAVVSEVVVAVVAVEAVVSQVVVVVLVAVVAVASQVVVVVLVAVVAVASQVEAAVVSLVEAVVVSQVVVAVVVLVVVAVWAALSIRPLDQRALLKRLQLASKVQRETAAPNPEHVRVERIDRYPCRSHP